MKKFLGIFVYSLLVLLLIIFVSIHFIYHSFSPNDKGIVVEKTNLVFYNNTYEECRQAFRDEARNLASKYEQTELFSIMVPSEIDQDLSIDLLYLPPLQETDKLLVLSSGVHGVEGYTGSAVQQMFMQELLNSEVLSEMGVLIIHAVNPYGFKYLRRQTENNVDLNRGSEIDPGLFSKKNPGYGELIDMLAPEGMVSTESIANKFFYVTAINKILKASMSTTRQAIVQGQYEYPEGLFFGGNSFEPQIDSLKVVLPDYLSSYSTILEIDLHTAFGTRNVLHLFPNTVSDPVIRKKTEQVFEGHPISWGDSDNFYTVSGGFADAFISKLIPDAQYLYMVFEWGTFDTEKTFGSVKSLQMMINENQGHHYGYKNDVQEKKVKKAILEMEYPSSEAWRSETMRTGREMLSLVLRTYPEIQ